jgi:CDP-glycerol glycerophosphotransferase (TagB/SpsB family)
VSTPKAKRHTYPKFYVSGLVSFFEHDHTSATLTIKASGYVSFQWDASSMLVRDAKWRLERAGLPKESLDALHTEYVGITECFALDARNVRSQGFERIEAFLDSPSLKKRDVLIRQRRVIPYDQPDMVAMYGPKVVEAVAEAVAA